LHEHFEKVHPQRLKSFEHGWNILPIKVQNDWINDGLKPQAKGMDDSYYFDDPGPSFSSWSEYVYDKYSLMSNSRDRDFFYESTWATLYQQLDHEGTLYGLPPLSGEGKSLVHLKGRIVVDAIERYLKFEREEALSRLMDKIDEEGYEYLLSYFKQNEIDWPCPSTESDE